MSKYWPVKKTHSVEINHVINITATELHKKTNLKNNSINNIFILNNEKNNSTNKRPQYEQD